MQSIAQTGEAHDGCPHCQVAQYDFGEALKALTYDPEALAVQVGLPQDHCDITLANTLILCGELVAAILLRIHNVPYGPNRLKKQMRIAQKEYLTSYPAKVVAAARVMGLNGIGGKAGQPVTLDDVLTAAAKVDVQKPCQDPIRAFWKPKDKGGFRLLCDFGVHHRIQHTMLSDALLAAGVDNEFDFTRRGAGNEIGFRDEVINALEDGYDWWLTTDVANCFTSLKPGHFKGFHIDRITMRNVAYIPKCAKVLVLQKGSPALVGYLESAYPDLMATYASLTPYERMRRVTIDIVRRGLPQGSCLSNVLARAFIGRELRKLLEDFDARPACWIDDLAIGFQTEMSAKAAEGFLLEQFLQQPAGQVQFRETKLQWAGKKRLDILGYVFELERGYNDTPVHVRPGGKRIRRHRRKLVRKLAAAWSVQGGLSFDDAHWLGDQYARSWYGSMRAWTKVPYHSKTNCLHAVMSYVEDFRAQKAKSHPLS